MQNIFYMPSETQTAFRELKHYLEPKLTGLCERDVDMFLLRLERYFADFMILLRACTSSTPTLTSN